MSRSRLVIALILFTASVWLLGRFPLTGRAHAELQRSEPSANAVIPQAPAEVHLWFSQELFRREGANTLAVLGPKGTQVDNGDARIDDDDRAHMLVSLPPGLPDGLYTVQWRNLSVEDGHEGSGEFGFTVASGSIEGGDSSDAALSATLPAKTPAAAPAPQPGPTMPCLSGLLLSPLLVSLPWRQRGKS